MKMSLRRFSRAIRLIDGLFLGKQGLHSCYALVNEGTSSSDTSVSFSLIDPGASSCYSSVDSFIGEMKEVGGEMESIIVTHAHLDHIGSIGQLSQACEHDTLAIYCHPKAKGIIMYPENLYNGTRRVYGDDYFELAFSTHLNLSLPPERILAVGDEEEAGGLKFNHSEAHCRHHLVVHEPESNAMFVGDCVGIMYEWMDFLVPTYPGEASFQSGYATLELIEAIDPDVIYLPHFGGHKDVKRMVEASRANLQVFERMQNSILCDVSEKGVQEILEDVSFDMYATIYRSTAELARNVEINSRGLLLKARKKMWGLVKELVEHFCRHGDFKEDLMYTDFDCQVDLAQILERLGYYNNVNNNGKERRELEGEEELKKPKGLRMQLIKSHSCYIEMSIGKGKNEVILLFEFKNGKIKTIYMGL